MKLFEFDGGHKVLAGIQAVIDHGQILVPLIKSVTGNLRIELDQDDPRIELDRNDPPGVGDDLRIMRARLWTPVLDESDPDIDETMRFMDHRKTTDEIMVFVKTLCRTHGDLAERPLLNDPHLRWKFWRGSDMDRNGNGAQTTNTFVRALVQMKPGQSLSVKKSANDKWYELTYHRVGETPRLIPSKDMPRFLEALPQTSDQHSGRSAY